MKIFSLFRFKCPKCGLEGDQPNPDLQDAINCLFCGFSVKYLNKVWDSRINTKGRVDFSEQWKLWEKGWLGNNQIVYGNAESEDFKKLLTMIDLSEKDLSDKKILEIGFGHGRILRQFQNHCPRAIGLDLVYPPTSSNLQDGSVIRGDLFNMPLAPRQFDLVICRGVVHHTYNTKKAFERAADQVAEGGKIYMYIYERFVPKPLLFRKIFPMSWRLPCFARFIIAHSFGFLWALYKMCKEYKFSGKFFRGYYGNYTLAVFDVISPQWIHMHNPEEVQKWFRDAGFTCEYKGNCKYIGVRNRESENSDMR